MKACRCSVLGHRAEWAGRSSVCVRKCCRGRRHGIDVRGGFPLVLALLDRIGSQPEPDRPFQWYVGDHVTVYYPRVKWHREPFYLRGRWRGWTLWALRLAVYWDQERTP